MNHTCSPYALRPRTDLQVVASGTAGGNAAMVQKQLQSVGVPTGENIGEDIQCLGYGNMQIVAYGSVIVEYIHTAALVLCERQMFVNSLQLTYLR